jgi:hypothetical protein
LPERDVENYAIPVTGDNIIDWISFDYKLVFCRNNIDIPENRRHPKSELYQYVYHLFRIFNKNINRGCNPA